MKRIEEIEGIGVAKETKAREQERAGVERLRQFHACFAGHQQRTTPVRRKERALIVSASGAPAKRSRMT